MTNRPTLLLPDAGALEGVPVAELPALIAQLAALQAAAAIRLHQAPASDVPRLLTAAEAAERLRVGIEWVEKRSRKLPFRVSLADGTVRYDPAGLTRWLAARTGQVR